jgi:hypothetical protein
MTCLKTPIGLLLIFILSGCSKFSADQKASIQVLIEEGRKLALATEAGLTRSEFKKSLISYKDAYELALVKWPKSVHAESKEDFTNALRLWMLADWMWNHEQELKEAVRSSLDPNPRLESWGIWGVSLEEHLQIVFQRLEVPRKYQGMFLVEGSGSKKGKGKSHIPFRSIGLILNEAAKSFKAARASVLSDL